MNPTDLRYTKEHEWIRLIDDEGTIGITHYAQEQLGDVVYVEFPKVGAKLDKMQVFGVVESVKTASDLYSPISGNVTEVNESLITSPELVNSDPYGAGWMIKVKVADTAEVAALLSAQQYQDQLPR